MGKTYNCNLNIWYYMSDEVWKKIANLYERMPGWNGYHEGIPYWYGLENDLETISASVEPSGLQFFARMDDIKWHDWIENFKMMATEELGYEVGESEDDFI